MVFHLGSQAAGRRTSCTDGKAIRKTLLPRAFVRGREDSGKSYGALSAPNRASETTNAILVVKNQYEIP